VAQTVAYLPDGRLAVDRSMGCAVDDGRLKTGVFELELSEDGWSSRYEAPRS